MICQFAKGSIRRSCSIIQFFSSRYFRHAKQPLARHKTLFTNRNGRSLNITMILYNPLNLPASLVADIKTSMCVSSCAPVALPVQLKNRLISGNIEYLHLQPVRLYCLELLLAMSVWMHAICYAFPILQLICRMHSQKACPCCRQGDGGALLMSQCFASVKLRHLTLSCFVSPRVRFIIVFYPYVF